MPEEHTGQLGFEYAWKELLARTRNAGKLSTLMSGPAGSHEYRQIHDVQFGAVRYRHVQDGLEVSRISYGIRVYYV